jgi:hypothetical protein
VAGDIERNRPATLVIVRLGMHASEVALVSGGTNNWFAGPLLIVR